MKIIYKITLFVILSFQLCSPFFTISASLNNSNDTSGSPSEGTEEASESEWSPQTRDFISSFKDQVKDFIENGEIDLPADENEIADALRSKYHSYATYINKLLEEENMYLPPFEPLTTLQITYVLAICIRQPHEFLSTDVDRNRDAVIEENIQRKADLLKVKANLGHILETFDPGDQKVLSEWINKMLTEYDEIIPDNFQPIVRITSDLSPEEIMAKLDEIKGKVQESDEGFIFVLKRFGELLKSFSTREAIAKTMTIELAEFLFQYYKFLFDNCILDSQRNIHIECSTLDHGETLAAKFSRISPFSRFNSVNWDDAIRRRDELLDLTQKLALERFE